MTLNERIRQLEQKITILESTIDSLLRDNRDKDLQPYSNIISPAKLENFDAVLIDGIWRARGALEIDVKNTYLVQKNDDGTIKKDSNGNEMKSPLLYTLGTITENLNKSNVIWDEEAQCWRFYAVFKPLPEE